MADVKISQLPVATTPLDGTEVLPIVQSATTKQVSIANVTAGRAVSALSLSLTNALPVTSGGTGIATTAAGTLLSSTALNTISATATPTLGVAGTTAGTLGLSGVTSGVVTLATASAAGTWTFTLPTSGGTNGYFLKTDGTGATSWAAVTVSGLSGLGTNVATALGNTANAASGIAVFDASNNFGVGVTPSSWISTVRAFEVALGGSGFSSSTANGNLNFMSNAYLDTSSNYVYVRNSRAVRFSMSNTAGEFYWYNSASGTAGATVTFLLGLTLDANSNLVLGSGALATSATNGFLYIPTCAGAPTGTPTSYSGRAPIVYDTTNNKIYVYNGAWKATAALT